MSAFVKELQEAMRAVERAQHIATAKTPAGPLTSAETRQALAEIKLAIDCLIYAAQPQPNSD